MNSIAQDVWYAVRQLRRHPTFALATVLVLGLGVGANSAVFSVVDAVLLRALPFAHVERIVPDDLWPIPTYRDMLFVK